MIALSFLGTGNYSATAYTWKGRHRVTRFMPVAVRDLFEPEELLVAETSRAREVHGDALAKACSYTSVSVPNGMSEDAWWRLFNAITDAVPEGASLLVDITHGFRSQPFLAMAIVLYLRVVKDVTIERIVYGAFEAGDGKQSPIIDLTPFLHLVDWTSATQQFQRYGNATPLRVMFRQIEGESRNGDRVALHLRPAGDTLHKLTNGLALNRPIETLENANGFINSMERAMDDARKIPQARPVKRLMVMIAERFAPMSHAEGSVFTQRGFLGQAAMLRFYVDTDQYLQAFTLAQEMLVSWVCVQNDLDPLDRGHEAGDDQAPTGRKGARSLLYHWENNKETPEARALSSRERAVVNLWTRLRSRRNDVAHAGFGHNPMPAHQLIEDADELLHSVADFFSES